MVRLRYFLTATSTPVKLTKLGNAFILGAILFLRFGYVVGSVGFLGALAIIGMNHLVTIPTAMAIAEIATNNKVEGGGEYYIISKSFGLSICAAIGIALFFSQAISIAFYIIAFAEAFNPVLDYLNSNFELGLTDIRIVSIPALILLGVLMIPIGLACAAMSPALGSVMVAPRTLQAIANDKIFPNEKVNEMLSKGTGAKKEPMNATIKYINE